MNLISIEVTETANNKATKPLCNEEIIRPVNRNG